MPGSRFSGGSPTKLVPVELVVSVNYTVKSVNGSPRPWEYPKDSGNWNDGYKLTLEDGQEVEHSIKKGKPAPQPGDVIFGYIEEATDPRFPAKLKKAKTSTWTGGGGGWGKSPGEQKSIMRQHSQEMALRALGLAFELQLYDAQEDWVDPNGLRVLISKWADFFDGDIANGKAGEQ